MPPFHHSKRSYNIIISLYKTIIILHQFYQNMHDQNAGNMSQNFLGKLIPYIARVQVKSLDFI